MGCGIILTNACSPRQLPDLPFGVKYDPVKAASGLKNNLLCEHLSEIEILRFQRDGFCDPAYKAMSDGYKIFTMIDSRRITGAPCGFLLRPGGLVFVQDNAISYVLTFSFVMLLISINPQFPSVIRKAAVELIDNSPISMPLKPPEPLLLNDFIERLLKKNSNKLGSGVCAKTINNCTTFLGQNPKFDLSSEYTPQSGQLPPISPLAEEKVEKLMSRIDMTNVSPLLSNFKESLGKAGYLYLSYLMSGDWRAFTLLLIIAYFVYRICVQLIFTFSFFTGAMVGWYLCGQEQQLRKMYRPQSGNDTEGSGSALVHLYCRFSELVRQLDQGIRSLDSIPEVQESPYSPQSAAEESQIPEEATPSEEPGALTDGQQRELHSAVTRISDHQLKEAIVMRTNIDIANWQKDPKTYPLPRDILNRGVAFSPVMQATLHDALQYTPVKKLSLGFGKP